MKRFTLLIIAALFALNTTVFSQRGHLIGVIPQSTLSPEEIMTFLQLQMPDLNYSLIDYLPFVAFI